MNRPGIAILAAVVLSVVVSANAQPVVYNAGFEAPVVGAGSNLQNPTVAQQGGAGWDFAGLLTGIADDTVFWGLPSPEGVQAAYMQIGGDEVAQTISGFEIGKTYTVSWIEAARPGYTVQRQRHWQ